MRGGGASRLDAGAADADAGARLGEVEAEEGALRGEKGAGGGGFPRGHRQQGGGMRTVAGRKGSAGLATWARAGAAGREWGARGLPGEAHEVVTERVAVCVSEQIRERALQVHRRHEILLVENAATENKFDRIHG